MAVDLNDALSTIEPRLGLRQKVASRRLGRQLSEILTVERDPDGHPLGIGVVVAVSMWQVRTLEPRIVFVVMERMITPRRKIRVNLQRAVANESRCLSHRLLMAAAEAVPRTHKRTAAPRAAGI